MAKTYKKIDFMDQAPKFNKYFDLTYRGRKNGY